MAHGLLARRTALLGALFALVGPAVSPVESGCSSATACPGFDDCKDALPCAHVRCECDHDVADVAATCRSDGTCLSSLDCTEICKKIGATCHTAPASCSDFTENECECTADSQLIRFAEVWNCAGASDPPTTQDCFEACHPDGAGGGATSSSVGPGVGGSLSAGTASGG